MTMSHCQVDGYCPACGESYLTLEKATGMVTCGLDSELIPGKKCPDPLAAHKLLQDKQIDHLVRFDRHGFFIVKHPLVERINDTLFDCDFHARIVADCEGIGGPGEGLWLIRPYSGDNPCQVLDWERMP